MAKTSMNLEENVASLLCYLATWITGIIFFAMEKENKTVRFHAMQSILLFLPMMIVGWIFIGPLGWTWETHTGPFGIAYKTATMSPLYYIGVLIYLLMFVAWIVLMITAYQGRKIKIPVIGDIAEKQAQK
jgi:uncharacterized membrane protein